MATSNHSPPTKRRKLSEGHMEVTTNGTHHLDEGLYSRQLYVLGKEAMQKMSQSNILLIGLQGVGIEIAKNLILTGVAAVYLYDNDPVQISDLSTQFYLTEENLGQKRSTSCLNKLIDLNNYVQVYTIEEEPTSQKLIDLRIKTVVVTSGTLTQMLKWNEICRENKIHFVSANVYGVFGSIFCDFGPEFEVVDVNGESPQTYMIASVTQDTNGVVTLVDDTRLDLETGDWVTFTEVKGLEGIDGESFNHQQPQQITILGPYTFSIGDTRNLTPYISGGYVHQVKRPIKINFSPLRESLLSPKFVTTDWAKLEKPNQILLAIQALDTFISQHGRYPKPYDRDDSKTFIELAQKINTEKKQVESVNESDHSLFSFVSSGGLAPMDGFIGGIAAQEVLKSCTGKFTPIEQWLIFDSVEILPDYQNLDSSHFAPNNSRYDAQIAVIGKDLQEEIHKLKYFLVGSGAIGCEILKNWALMGLGTKGIVHVTDMDIIEKSNLNRQFLFRNQDLEKLKSETAAQAVKQMNPSMNIKSYSLRVGSETENVFNDDFFEELSGVCNALDNVEARLYMDSRCVFYGKSLLESGTLGTKGNTQVVVPYLTESYASSRDPPDPSIPQCTLHHFPNKIEHCLAWARDTFAGLFSTTAENAISYLKDPKAFLSSLNKQGAGVRAETLDGLYSSLVSQKPSSIQDCIAWARLQFQDFYYNNIEQLLYNFPLDMVHSTTGVPFWSGPKKAPTAIIFDPNDSLHLEFIKSAANLRAFNYNIPQVRDKGDSWWKESLKSVVVPKFQPKKKIIQTSENEPVEPSHGDINEHDRFDEIVNELSKHASSLNSSIISVVDFEKDDDTNFHMDFITSCSNLRATNYSIALADRQKSKLIAGKIIPAMVTTTSIVSGLVCLELIKLIQKNKKIEDFKNGFVNLAISFFGFSEPIATPKTKVTDEWSWSIWDRFDLEGDMTLKEFLEYFKQKKNLDITMMSCENSLLYSIFMNKERLESRLPSTISKIVETIQKKPLSLEKKYLIIEICCSMIDSGEDVDVPTVRLKFRK